jgi:magnesium-transporting ATPase (P-type)
MQRKNLYYNALISFIIFIIIVCKDILVSYIQIIPERSPLNRLISWLLILPFSIIGTILSIKVVKYYIFYWNDKHRILIDKILILSLPILLYISYFIFQFIISF